MPGADEELRAQARQADLAVDDAVVREWAERCRGTRELDHILGD